MIRRSGLKCIKTFEKDEVVGVVTFKGKLVIATKHGVYLYPEKENDAKHNNTGKS